MAFLSQLAKKTKQLPTTHLSFFNHANPTKNNGMLLEAMKNLP